MLPNTTKLGFLRFPLVLLLLAATGFRNNGYGVDNIAGVHIEAVRIEAGTLTPLPAPRWGYVFRSDGGAEEVYDKSGAEFLVSKKLEFPGDLPGLREIGFKMDNGKAYFYQRDGGEFGSESRTIKLAEKENPGRKGFSRIFEGKLGGTRLEIALAGATPVLRTTVRINGVNVTFWANRVPDPAAK
jgi:hypothetical protein